jgi:uncharacterized protein
MHAILNVGPVEAASGSSASGLVTIGELADGTMPVQIPVIIVNGRDDGPVVYLHAGSHGQETPYAVETFRRLRAGLDASALKGAIIAVPVANLLAHHFATRVAPHYAAREGVPFAGDLHKLWPGDEVGSLTQRIAHFLWTRVVSQSDCAIDYHAVGEPGIPFAFLYRGGSREALGARCWEKTVQMARAFGLTLITTAPNSLTLAGSCLDAGKPAFMVEMNRGRALDEKVVAGALRGTRNVLVHLGMIEGALVPQPDFLVLPGVHAALPTIRANRGGIIRFEVECGDFLPSGTVIARICDVFGAEVEAVAMPQDGYVMTFPPMSWVGSQSVATGDLVADVFV